MKTDLFFVYGTLKKGGYFAHEFDSFRITSEKAMIYNTALYDLGDFPGLVMGNSIVKGELHKYSHPDIVLRKMDIIEGYHKDVYSLYIRKRMTVITENSKKNIAYVYLFNQELGKYAKLIEDGVWKERY